ncbi:MAG: T7SS effector LXG polymorphic toxin [Acidobacteriota bacterium]|nr:T7SS effector LXG polymorphic toxin [Acidobacteriota bacterium]
MGFNILVTDVDNLGGFLTSYQSTVGDQLAAVNDAAVVVSGLTDFQGDAATAVKAYWGEAHTITVAALNEAMTDLVVRYALYADGYGSDAIDGARDAKLDQETIDESSQDMESVLPDVESRRTRLSSALESISDILPLAEPDTNGITDSLEDASLIASQLSQRVAEHEAAHVGSAREVSGLISAVEAVLGDLETRYSSGNGYSSNDFASSQAFTDLSAAYMAVAGHIRENADAATDIYQRIGERQQERYEEWERQQAEEREKRGYAEMLAGGALLIVGVAVCVGSGGAAAPIVLGAATAVFGASDMVEGAQDVYYGSRGDMASVTFNPLRDTVFMGNQQIYSLVEMTVSTLACLSVPVTAAISTAPPGASAFAVGGRALAMGGARMAGGIAVTQYVIDPTIAALAGGGENGRIAVGLVNLGLTVYAARSGAFSTERAIAVERQRLQTEIPEIESQTGLEGEHVRVEGSAGNEPSPNSGGVRGIDDPVDIELKFKDGWTEAQRQEALAKCQALSEADTRYTTDLPERTYTRQRYINEGGIVGPTQDMDHLIDLQLGGSDEFSNLHGLDRSVNRSLGSQIHNQLVNMQPGQRIGEVTIK